mmetsp:Transcript_7822/g.11609  ORF Transcript_7822/g.11609 Transcript_7822/m.11609 type:complete len:111 (+) Transcript_7822:1492-1824(+)
MPVALSLEAVDALEDSLDNPRDDFDDAFEAVDFLRFDLDFRRDVNGSFEYIDFVLCALEVKGVTYLLSKLFNFDRRVLCMVVPCVPGACIPSKSKWNFPDFPFDGYLLNV